MGAVVPVLRQNAKSFSESLDIIRQQNIAGLSINHDLVARRLDRALKESDSSRITTTERNTSISYGEQILKNLDWLTKSNDKQFSIVRSFLENTSLHIAIQDIVSNGDGLTRSSFFQLLLNQLTLNENIKFSDAGLQLYKPSANLTNKSVGASIQTLTTLGTMVYHQNLSNNYNSLAYFSGSSLERVSQFEKILNISHELNHDNLIEPVETLEVSVKIPSILQLMTIGIERLLEIKKDFRYGFFPALKSWENAGINDDVLQKSLQEYCADITSKIKVEAPPSKIILSRFSDSDRAMLSASSSWLNKTIESVSGFPFFGLVTSMLGQLSTIAFNTYSEQELKVRINRPIVKRSAVVV